jgi:hypothetical protein
MIEAHFMYYDIDHSETNITVVIKSQKRDYGRDGIKKSNRGGEYDQNTLYDYMEMSQ